MSKIFYDHLLVLNEVEGAIRLNVSSLEEKEELWQIIDELIHHRVMAIILENLPREHHEEFLEKFTLAPYDQKLIVYLNDKSAKKIEDLIRKEAKKIESEIIKEIKKR
jgi:hypothetical protein